MFLFSSKSYDAPSKTKLSCKLRFHSFSLYQNVYSLLTLITGLRMKTQNAMRHALRLLFTVTIVIQLRNHFLYCHSWNRSVNQPRGQTDNKCFLNCARDSFKTKSMWDYVFYGSVAVKYYYMAMRKSEIYLLFIMDR